MGKRHLAYFLIWIEWSLTSLAVAPLPMVPWLHKVYKRTRFNGSLFTGCGPCLVPVPTGVYTVRTYHCCLLEVRVSVELSWYSHAADASVVPPALASGSRLP